MRMGAGVQAFEAYAAAHEHDVVVLGGECPTVQVYQIISFVQCTSY